MCSDFSSCLCNHLIKIWPISQWPILLLVSKILVIFWDQHWKSYIGCSVRTEERTVGKQLNGSFIKWCCSDKPEHSVEIETSRAAIQYPTPYWGYESFARKSWLKDTQIAIIKWVELYLSFLENIVVSILVDLGHTAVVSSVWHEVTQWEINTVRSYTVT